jgi:FkbM family methyltransferase
MKSRPIRRAALSLFSSSRRAALRRLYDSATAPSSGTKIEISRSGTDGLLTIEGGRSIGIPVDCLADVEQHFATREAAAELDRFLSHARTPGFLFDVGANNGLFSVAYCLAHPANRAVAFEPSSPLVERIRQMARLNGVEDRLQVVAKAVADSPGERQLMLATRGSFVQVAPFAGTAQNEWQSLPIETTTLDLETAGTARPTVLKIDVEGFEWEVVRGAASLIANARPTIFLEVHLNYLEQRGISPLDIIRPIATCGYEFTDLSGRRRSERSISKSWASVLHIIGNPAGAGPAIS